MATFDFVTVPPGRYLCRVAEVRTGTTPGGNERWSLSLIVAGGEYTGRLAAWDSIMFAARGQARARRVLRALGLTRRRGVAIQPDDLRDHTAIVEVRPVEHRTAHGDSVRRNEVPNDGWTPQGPACGHSVCSQHFIDTGKTHCVQNDGRADA